MSMAQFCKMTRGEQQLEIQEAMAQAFRFFAESARSLRATVKQLRTSNLDPRSREQLDACFPGFQEQQEISNWLAKGGVQWEITSTGTNPTTMGRQRRFAGDELLPGGRYYSICRDHEGDDGGTLVWELMTYWGANASAFPELVDSTVHRDAVTKLRSAMPQLGTRPFLLLKASKISSVTAEKIELDNTVGVVLPLTVQDLEVDGVIDLRIPEVQDGFAETLGGLETTLGWFGPTVMVKERPKAFVDILPTLITPRPGGTTFHQAVGALCRASGVSGLVFPSARRDFYVTSHRNGRVEESDGWNFVDYRDSWINYEDRDKKGAEFVIQLFGKQIKWLRQEQVGVQIDWEDDGLKRMWRVVGAERGERRRYDIEWEIRRGVRTPSVMWTPWFAGRGASG